MFTQQDISQILDRGCEPSTVENQITHFISGFPYLILKKPATAGDGILVCSENEIDDLTEIFEEHRPHLKITKFVPASGAASRMFKHLFEYSEKYSAGNEKEKILDFNKDFNSVDYFIGHLKDLALYSSLEETAAEKGISINELLENQKYSSIINLILDPAGLDYSSLPKALLLFHDYPEGARTAAEEHLVESAEYARDIQGIAHLHFTISPEHRQKFNDLFAAVLKDYEARFDTRFDISYSLQKPSTDTIAVDEHNNPFRTPEGRLLFRPGGHGALIENLNEIRSDLIFIKNIDNIVPDRLKAQTYRYKKVIGGLLIRTKQRIDIYLKLLATGHLAQTLLDEIRQYAEISLGLAIPDEFTKLPADRQERMLFNLLNRPVRVCGMVKNEGEPGGGPFWVLDRAGNASLQIVESSQIDMRNSEQREIVKSSTHFNPVDLVCSTIDYQGNPFDIRQFVDEETGFISLKSSGGKVLKAQELPGLWNGAMARWITLFVEVPIITFNPVKTINDLLRKEHLR